MQRLVFSDDLITGVEAIDEQHGELLAWGNELFFPAALVAKFAAWLREHPGLGAVTEASEEALRQMGFEPGGVWVVRPGGLLSPAEAGIRSGN